MKIRFLGVGEACDSNYGNTSILVQTLNDSILLDCGFNAAQGYFSACNDPNELSVVWISHFHGDHFFGMPLLFLRFWEMGRKRPLIIAGGEGGGGKIIQAMELAYPNFIEKLGYDLQFLHFKPGENKIVRGIRLTAAAVEHSQQALALRLAGGKSAVYYSGDGRPFQESRQLAVGCSLLVQEAYSWQEVKPGHFTAAGAIKFARQVGAETLALVHVNRKEREAVRQRLRDSVQERQQGELKILLPEPGDEVILT